MSLLATLALVLSAQVAVSDLYARRVSNRWLAGVATVAVAWLAYAWALQNSGFPGTHLAGMVLGLVALLPFHALGWMGAGDVKYFAVLGLLLGVTALLPIWIASSLLAGVHAVCVGLAPAVQARLPLRAQHWQARAAAHWQSQPFTHQLQALRQGRVGIPYAAYLAFATLGWIAFHDHGGLS